MPRVWTIACGSPPSLQQISNKSLAILPEIVPAAIRSRIAPSCAADTGEAAMLLPSLLSRPASSLIVQLAAALASRPFATASKKEAKGKEPAAPACYVPSAVPLTEPTLSGGLSKVSSDGKKNGGGGKQVKGEQKLSPAISASV